MPWSELLSHFIEVVLLIVGVFSWAAVSKRLTGWKREMKEYAKTNHFAIAWQGTVEWH